MFVVDWLMSVLSYFGVRAGARAARGARAPRPGARRQRRALARSPAAVGRRRAACGSRGG